MTDFLASFRAVPKTKERIDILESKLGTCDSFDDEDAVVFGVDEADMGVFMEMWDIGFLCEQCGWWCEMHDLSEDAQICNECAE